MLRSERKWHCFFDWHIRVWYLAHRYVVYEVRAYSLTTFVYLLVYMESNGALDIAYRFV